MEKDFIEELNDIEILEDKVEERLLDLVEALTRVLLWKRRSATTN